MGINHGGVNMFMPEQILNFPYVNSIHEQMRSKAVTQGMHAGVLNDTGLAQRLPHSALQHLFTKMMSAYRSGARINRALCRWKDILPTPLTGSFKIFPLKGIRQKHLTEAVF